MEELLAHHLSLRRQRIALQAHHAPPLAGPGTLAKALLKQLPPVAAQPDAAAGAGRRRLRQDRGCRAGGDAGGGTGQAGRIGGAH
ncbi:hypothetical protein G6F55_013943 [Rhizopus delemar]|uniref:Uncharacterized protein n=1 Tax=Rhizopus delemar TaxID=936053 RepID=A0A9P6XQP0_9FUNG|nr:hypothetical protein G6F55_013943 [Rhizopus delemar]KAG1530447.1 hypothetical protein G6F50_017312 [Rhizopus delemar]